MSESNINIRINFNDINVNPNDLSNKQANSQRNVLRPPLPMRNNISENPQCALNQKYREQQHQIDKKSGAKTIQKPSTKVKQQESKLNFKYLQENFTNSTSDQNQINNPYNSNQKERIPLSMQRYISQESINSYNSSQQEQSYNLKKITSILNRRSPNSPDSSPESQNDTERIIKDLKEIDQESSITDLYPPQIENNYRINSQQNYRYILQKSEDLSLKPKSVSNFQNLSSCNINDQEHVKFNNKNYKKHEFIKLKSNYQKDNTHKSKTKDTKENLKKYQEQQVQDEIDDTEYSENLSQLFGCFLLILASCFFVLTIYSLFLAKSHDNSMYILIYLLRKDFYYCYLVPMLIPISFLFAYSNWVAMKFFRHA